jgi:hypothetical protein
MMLTREQLLHIAQRERIGLHAQERDRSASSIFSWRSSMLGRRPWSSKAAPRCASFTMEGVTQRIWTSTRRAVATYLGRD